MMTSAKRTEVMSIIKAYSGQQNVIGIPRIYVKLTGDYASAALLNQILYWSERTSDPDGWFYKSYAEWEGELYLSQYQVKRIIEGDKRSKSKTCLKDLGVETILKKSKKGVPTLHYRIDDAVFMKALMAQIEADNETQKPIIDNVDNPVMNNVDNPPSTMLTTDSKQCSQSLRTKTTTKTTTKNKTSVSDAHDAPPSPFIDDSHNGIFATVAKWSFNFDKGDTIPKAIASRIGKAVKTIRELDPVPTVAEVSKAYQQDAELNSHINRPNDGGKLAVMVQHYRKSSDYQEYERQRDRVMNYQEPETEAAAPPSPEPLERPLDWQPKTPEDFAWIDAQPDHLLEDGEAERILTAFEALVKSKTSKRLEGKIPPSLGESA